MLLNDLSSFMKMEHLELHWLKQDVPSIWKPGIAERWSACVSSTEKIKGERGRHFSWGYGLTPEEAILDAVDKYKNPPVPPVRKQVNITLDDLELDL